MPKPPAAFSPLMTTKSSCQPCISAGRRSVTLLRPLRPTMSPKKRIRTQLRPEIDGPTLRHHEIEARVAAGRRHRGNFLRRKRDADRRDGLHGAKAGNGQVVVSGAVTDAMAATIECEH